VHSYRFGRRLRWSQLGKRVESYFFKLGKNLSAGHCSCYGEKTLHLIEKETVSLMFAGAAG
jgi:hypothetical protein